MNKIDPARICTNRSLEQFMKKHTSNTAAIKEIVNATRNGGSIQNLESQQQFLLEDAIEQPLHFENDFAPWFALATLRIQLCASQRGAVPVDFGFVLRYVCAACATSESAAAMAAHVLNANLEMTMAESDQQLARAILLGIRFAMHSRCLTEAGPQGRLLDNVEEKFRSDLLAAWPGIDKEPRRTMVQMLREEFFDTEGATRVASETVSATLADRQF